MRSAGWRGGVEAHLRRGIPGRVAPARPGIAAARRARTSRLVGSIRVRGRRLAAAPARRGSRPPAIRNRPLAAPSPDVRGSAVAVHRDLDPSHALSWPCPRARRRTTRSSTKVNCRTWSRDVRQPRTSTCRPRREHVQPAGPSAPDLLALAADGVQAVDDDEGAEPLVAAVGEAQRVGAALAGLEVEAARAVDGAVEGDRLSGHLDRDVDAGTRRGAWGRRRPEGPGPVRRDARMHDLRSREVQARRPGYSPGRPLGRQLLAAAASFLRAASMLMVTVTSSPSM